MKTIILTCLSVLLVMTLWVSCKKNDDNPAPQPFGTMYCSNKSPLQIKTATGFFTLPNCFSPNGDGKNDIYRPEYTMPVTDYRLSVGRSDYIVFSSDTPGKSWDGYYIESGNLKPYTGNFVVTLRFRTSTGSLIDTCTNLFIPPTDSVQHCLKVNLSQLNGYYFPDQVNSSTGDFDRPTSESICP